MRILIFLLGLVIHLQAKDITIVDPASLPSADPGDTLILPEGEFRDVAVIFNGSGTKTKPITLKAAVPGKSIFSGKSTLRLSGEHLIIEGLHFKEPDPTVSDLILFRKDSRALANHCRLTNSSISSTLKEDGTQECRWLGIYGTGNRVDHCSFTGKTGKGTTFVVWLGKEGHGRHQIDHNYFGPREKLGKNGGETIRLGDSKTSMLTAACIIERNLFEKCNGEAECISNKSCGNIYRENTFLEVGGTLTLRHGNGCTVERNIFIGNEINGTGGIRVIGEDHIIRDNYLENLTGDKARSAICLMLGVPNSPANRYFQVQRARITGNHFVNCEHPICIGLSDGEDASLPPVETLFEGNQIQCPQATLIDGRCEISGVSWKSNTVIVKALGIPATPGVQGGTPKISTKKPILRSEVGPYW